MRTHSTIWTMPKYSCKPAITYGFVRQIINTQHSDICIVQNKLHQLFAIKYANISDESTGYAYGPDATIIKEIAFIQKLNHPNIVNLRGIALDTRLGFVMDAEPYTLDNLPPITINLTKLSYQLLCATYYLHSWKSVV